MYPASDLPRSNGVGDAFVTASSSGSRRSIALFATNRRSARPGALGATTQSAAGYHAVMRFDDGAPIGSRNGSQRPGAQRIAGLALPPSAIRLSIAMNHWGVLRKITGFFERRMRILMLEPPARQQACRRRPAP